MESVPKREREVRAPVRVRWDHEDIFWMHDDKDDDKDDNEEARRRRTWSSHDDFVLARRPGKLPRLDRRRRRVRRRVVGILVTAQPPAMSDNNILRDTSKNRPNLNLSTVSRSAPPLPSVDRHPVLGRSPPHTSSPCPSRHASTDCAGAQGLLRSFIACTN